MATPTMWVHERQEASELGVTMGEYRELSREASLLDLTVEDLLIAMVEDLRDTNERPFTT